MDFTKIIKEIMLEYRLTQTQLGDKLGIKQGHITSWVTGKTKPSFDHLRNICIKLDISGDRILGLSSI